MRDILKFLTFYWLFQNAGGCLKNLLTFLILGLLFILWMVGWLE